MRSVRRAERKFTVVEGARGFRIVLDQRGGDSFGMRLEEAYGNGGNVITSSIISTTPAQTARIIDALLAAIRKSGHKAGVLSSSRGAPIPLGEAEGVRLALILIATQPLIKHERVRALVSGINAMSPEETYYWYSKCVGIESNRARKALRTLLADN